MDETLAGLDIGVERQDLRRLASRGHHRRKQNTIRQPHNSNSAPAIISHANSPTMSKINPYSISGAPYPTPTHPQTPI